MGDATLRKSYHNKLRLMLKKVLDHHVKPLTYDDAREMMIRSQEIWASYEKVQEALLVGALDDSGYDLQEKEGVKVDDTYQQLRSKLRPLIEVLAPPPPTPAGSSAATHSAPNIRLPAIELPVFDGNLAEWTSFMDLFTAAVGGNASLSGAQKLQYLKSSVKGEPASLIRSLTTTDSNYSAALTILKDRYDNEKEIVHALINKLLGIRAVRNESATELQLLLDSFTECLRALKVMKRPADEWNDILVVLLMNKIDCTTRREWAIRQTGTSLTKFDDLTTFLRAHVRGLQSSEGGGQPAIDKRRERQVKVHMAATAAGSCLICNGTHPQYQCSDFRQKTVGERRVLANKHRMCFNCLGRDHMIKHCKWKGSCKKCGKKHHSLLHTEPPSKAESSSGTVAVEGARPSGENQVQQQSAGNINIHHAGMSIGKVLMTAVVNVKDSQGAMQPCRLFIDNGSEGEFIMERCCNRLGLSRRSARYNVYGFGDAKSGSTKGSVQATLFSRYDNDNAISLNFLVMQRMTGLLPSGMRKAGNWNHLDGLQLADPEWYRPGNVDIVIGIAQFHKILLHNRRVTTDDNAPVAWETIFGWAISGRCPGHKEAVRQYHVATNPVEDILKRFWEIEDIPTARVISPEEAECEKHYQETYQRDKTGRFVLQIPFKENISKLGRTRELAVQRFYQVERRMQRDPEFKRQYVEFMEEYERLGHMVIIDQSQPKELVGFTAHLPHHGVLNSSSTTTKLRVVFDGSAQSSSGISLNDTMMVGGKVQDDLWDILLRLRNFAVVVKSDMKKMYRQFMLHKPHANYHRIVWRKSPNDPLRDYMLLTLTYGTGPAAFLAVRSIEELARLISDKFPNVSKILSRNTYVDDILGGEGSAESAIKLYKDLTEALGTAGIELRKWASNDPAVMTAIPEEQRETEPLSFDEDSTVKALGVQWHPGSDTFKFKGVEFKHCRAITKRQLLSDASRVFDPLGFISCVSIRAKILLQETWKAACGWDEEVPLQIQQHWSEYKEDLKKLTKVSIPRRIMITPKSYEIHGYCDSSEKALGALVYVRNFNVDGSITVNFVTSKTRVAPVKLVSLPRLELEAALMLAKLVQRVVQCLELDGKLVLWSDSTITLKWIEGSPHRWKTFVGNRVAKIQRATPVEAWRHVPGADNPADLASRGVSAEELISNNFWWNGPTWLSEPGLPVFNDKEDVTEDLEERIVAVHHVEVGADLLWRFSTLIRLQRVTAYMLRFILKSRKRVDAQGRGGTLKVSELQEGLKLWIRNVQQQHFSEEIVMLKKRNRVAPNSKLKSLYPYLDSEGVIRVGGRLSHANLPEVRKHQIILPGGSHLVTLLVQHTHDTLFHGGFQLTWARLQSEYWIIGGRDKVRHFIRKCVRCRRYRARASEQMMGNLPEARVTTARPFLHSGVDYAGPFVLKNPVGRAPKTYKGYMCLFVCMATKAIHLEPVSSLSTEGFLEALRRFVSRRGLCAHIYSDCGSNFIGAEQELRTLLISRNSNNAIAADLSGKGVEWHFNPPSAPHHGGLWEAGVKSAKYHLRRVVGNNAMTYEQFHTVLCQIEAVLNSRPLYALSSDPGDLEALTPGHFLIGEALTAVPAANVEGVATNRLTQFQLQQQRVQHFWRRWSSEYLNTLQQRNKWRWESSNVKLGDLVLIVEETSPGTWKMGRVVEVHCGKDELVRVVTLKTVSGLVKRSISKLVPLINSD